MQHALERVSVWTDGWRASGRLVLLLDFDGMPIEDSRACRDPKQKRTVRTARLPTCTHATGLPAGARRTPSR